MSSVAQPRFAILQKLLSVMLDPAAEIGEAMNAADKLITVARVDGITYSQLREHFNTHRATDPTAGDGKPGGWYLSMPFGKHMGRELGEIVLDDPRYVAWLARDEFSDPLIRDAARDVLAWHKGGAR